MESRSQAPSARASYPATGVVTSLACGLCPADSTADLTGHCHRLLASRSICTLFAFGMENHARCRLYIRSACRGAKPCAQVCCPQGGEIAAASTYITEVGSHRVLARSWPCWSYLQHGCLPGTVGELPGCFSVRRLDTFRPVGNTATNSNILQVLARAFELELSGEEAASEWAWRLPFLTAIIPGLISARGRHNMPESKSSWTRVQAEAPKHLEALHVAMQQEHM